MISSASWISIVCVDWRNAPPGRLRRRGRTAQSESLTRVIKEVRVEFYTDAYAEWERENLGEVKVALDGIPRTEPAHAPA
jgi:hypothetical protein